MNTLLHFLFSSLSPVRLKNRLRTGTHKTPDMPSPPPAKH